MPSFSRELVVVTCGQRLRRAYFRRGGWGLPSVGVPVAVPLPVLGLGDPTLVGRGSLDGARACGSRGLSRGRGLAQGGRLGGGWQGHRGGRGKRRGGWSSSSRSEGGSGHGTGGSREREGGRRVRLCVIDVTSGRAGVRGVGQEGRGKKGGRSRGVRMV
jgi:hypothetical protein